MFSRLVEQMTEREGVTEQLKADNQIEWVGRMNNIRSRAQISMRAKLPSGKLPTTRVRRRISWFSRSMTLFVQFTDGGGRDFAAP